METFDVGIQVRTYNYRMRAARNRLGFTQNQMSMLTGIRNSTLCAIENLRQRPSKEQAQEIADALDEDVNVLFPEWLKPQRVREALNHNGAVELTEAAMVEGSDQLRKVLLIDVVRNAMEVLTEQERRVITARFGLQGDGPLTLEQIARTSNVTRERIRQIEGKALIKLGRTQALTEDQRSQPVGRAAEPPWWESEDDWDDWEEDYTRRLCAVS